MNTELTQIDETNQSLIMLKTAKNLLCIISNENSCCGKAAFARNQICQAIASLKKAIEFFPKNKKIIKIPKKYDYPLAIIKYCDSLSDDYKDERLDNATISKMSGYDQGGSGIQELAGHTFEDSKGRWFAVVAHCYWSIKIYEPDEYDYEENFRDQEFIDFENGIDSTNMKRCTWESRFVRVGKDCFTYKHWTFEKATEYKLQSKCRKQNLMNDAYQFLQMAQAISELTQMDTTKL